MNCRISLFLCNAIVWLLLSVSCQWQPAESVQVEYKRGFPVDTTITLQELPIEVPSTPALLYRLGNRLVLFGNYHILYIYSYPDLRFVRSCQLPKFALTDVIDDELYLEYQGKVDIYRLNPSDSLVWTRSFRVATVPYSVGSVHPLGKDTYIFTGWADIEGTHEFHIVNSKTGKWTSGGAYPESSWTRFKRLEDFRYAYSHGISVKPDRSAFVVTYTFLRRIHIYDADGTLRHALHLDYEPNNNHLVDPGYDRRFLHCTDVFVTDRYIYTVNPEQSMEYAVPYCEILMLDWEGNLKARYRLDMYINDIVVDEERKMIVGCGDKGKGKGSQFFKLKLINEY